MVNFFFAFAFLLLGSCGFSKKNRSRPSYNYAIMQKVKNDKNGYYKTDENFSKAYIEIMQETNDMSKENAYKIYKKQNNKTKP